MFKYRRILLALSFLFAIVTAFFGYKLLYNLSTQDTTIYLTIPVAKNNIDPMTEITDDLIDYIEVPEGNVSKLSIITDENQIIGEVSASKIQKNSPFVTSQLYDELLNNPFQLKDGYRAITIENSPLIGVGGHLKPDMFVDIIWTYVDNNSNIKRSQVIFQNIRVLAIGPPVTDQNASTVTLMLNLAEANRFALLEKTGSFKLVIRPSQKIPPENLPPFNLESYLLND